MDQQKSTTKSKNTILNFLPRATSSVSFQNPPIYSPSKSHKSHIGIGFLGPLLSTFASDQTQRRIKNQLDDDNTVLYEPTSPRVSCMGQVKCNYTKQKQKEKQKQKQNPNVLGLTSDTSEWARDIKDGHVHAPKIKESKSKKKIGFKKFIFGDKKDDVEKSKSKVPMYLDKVPSLGTMKRLSSGRDELSNFDWRSCNFEEERDDVIEPVSAPVVMRNIQVGFDEDKLVRVVERNREPRKEINLWKRRTMTQPKPLLLHNI